MSPRFAEIKRIKKSIEPSCQFQQSLGIAKRLPGIETYRTLSYAPICCDTRPKHMTKQKALVSQALQLKLAILKIGLNKCFFASHDYSRRFSGANIRIFFNTNAFQDKVHYINKRKSMD